jgi:hypothetical protein
MIELENKSCRGKLVKVIVKSYIKENLIESVDGLKEILQELLKLNLNFEAKVSGIEIKNGHIFIKIVFKDENDILRLIDVTITSNVDVV